MSESRGMGRPSNYRDEYAGQAEKLCKLGATDRELGDFFGVSEQTINAWKKAHPAFLEALKRGKECADAEVAEKLFRRATGYSHPAVKIFANPSSGDVLREEYTEHYPPDTTAAIFWLKNRRPDLWRDKHTQELTGAGGTQLVPVLNVTVGASGPQPAPKAGGGSEHDRD